MHEATGSSTVMDVGRTLSERWQLRRKPPRWSAFAMALVGVATVAVAVFGGLGGRNSEGSLLVSVWVWLSSGGRIG